jgi:hypothetical protein
VGRPCPGQAALIEARAAGRHLLQANHLAAVRPAVRPCPSSAAAIFRAGPGRAGLNWRLETAVG